MAGKLTYAFRITHISNIGHIHEHGLAGADSVLHDPGYVSIGDSSVIEVREMSILPNGIQSPTGI